MADKYTQAEIDELGKKGQAFGPGDDEHYSYPIADTDDLKDAIRAVGRGNADHDDIRKFVMKRAKALGESDLIPDNWQSDGSLSDADAKGRVWTMEQRDTANDCFQTLDGAISDAFGNNWCSWVQDWYGGSDPDDDPYTVIYYYDGDLWAATFTVGDDGKYVVDTENARKVRPCTLYIDRSNSVQFMQRTGGVDPEVRSAREGMTGWREERRMPTRDFEMREVSNGSGGTSIICEGYASVTCADRRDDSNAYEMEDAYGPWLESTVRGFAQTTLSQNCDTAFLVNHGGITMARTKSGSLKLSEDLVGLKYEARLNPARPDVQILREAVNDKDIDESSFAFRVLRQEWNSDYTRRWITEVSLDKGDVSPVNYGASALTANQPLTMRGRNQQRGLGVLVKRMYPLDLTQRIGKVLSADNQGKLEQGLESLHAADDADIPAIVRSLQTIDEALDGGMAAIAAVLGTVNPDGDAGDLEPELVPAGDAQRAVLVSSTLTRARLDLEALRQPPRRVA